MSDRRAVWRRIFHVAVSASVLYWWLPDPLLPMGIARRDFVIGGMLVLTALEAVRLARGAIVFPMREYERRRLGGHYWLVLGCAVALLLFEQRFAMITILGATLVDPWIGETKKSRGSKWAIMTGFAMWCAIAAICIILVPLPTKLELVPLGAAFAVGAEAAKVRFIDDNFLMIVVPLVALTAVASALSI